MINIQHIDLSDTFVSLEKALEVAAEEGIYETISVQRYIDGVDNSYKWRVSFSENIGQEIFSKERIKSTIEILLNVETMLQEIDFLEKLENEISGVWNSKNDIYVPVQEYQDEYEMNGISRMSFM